MIEEAAGTRMYENKKNAAIKTIAKKQTKVLFSPLEIQQQKIIQTNTEEKEACICSCWINLLFPVPQVDEINKILVEELTPTLESLRKERSSFMKYSANNTEVRPL